MTLISYKYGSFDPSCRLVIVTGQRRGANRQKSNHQEDSHRRPQPSHPPISSRYSICPCVWFEFRGRLQHIFLSRVYEPYFCELKIATPHRGPYQDHRAVEYLYLCEWSVSRQRLHFSTADLPRTMLIDVMICSDRAANATINTCESVVIFLDASRLRIARQGPLATH